MARLNYVKSFRGTTKTEDGCLVCEKCHSKIQPGDSYQWWANRLPGQRSSIRRIRCASCSPRLSERTPGRAGQLLSIQENVADQLGEFGGEADDLEMIVQDAADSIREIAEELRESAQNIEEGFGHPTSTSEELEERAESISGQCDEIEGIYIPDPPEKDEEGDEDAFQNEYDSWRDEAISLVEDAISEVDLY